MVDLFAKDVETGRFFATADPPPDNVFRMLVTPHNPENIGLCQNIASEGYWEIAGNRTVRLIAKEEYDNTVFHVL